MSIVNAVVQVARYVNQVAAPGGVSREFPKVPREQSPPAAVVSKEECESIRFKK